jgi:hypothetical protein
MDDVAAVGVVAVELITPPGPTTLSKPTVENTALIIRSEDGRYLALSHFW